MAHLLTISDDTYLTIATLAQERGQTPEELATALLQRQVLATGNATMYQNNEALKKRLSSIHLASHRNPCHP